MAETKSRLMDFSGCMATSHAFDEDQMPCITSRFFFTHRVMKFKPSIFDQTDKT